MSRNQIEPRKMSSSAHFIGYRRHQRGFGVAGFLTMKQMHLPPMHYQQGRTSLLDDFSTTSAFLLQWFPRSQAASKVYGCRGFTRYEDAEFEGALRKYLDTPSHISCQLDKNPPRLCHDHIQAGHDLGWQVGEQTLGPGVCLTSAVGACKREKEILTGHPSSKQCKVILVLARYVQTLYTYSME